MKKINNSIILLLLLLILFSSNVIALAEDIITSEAKEVEIMVSNENIDIQKIGESEYISVKALYSDGTIKDISDVVHFKVENSEIVNVINKVNDSYELRLLGNNIGKTEITLLYNDLTKNIVVNVLKKDEIIEELRGLELEKIQPNNTFRDWAIQKAKTMIDIRWTPTKDLNGWDGRDSYKFKANQAYTGIPYSQTAYQVDDTDFRYELNNNSSFYDRYTRFNRIMPKYGNDCSGFLSFAWSTTRNTTNDFITGIKNSKFDKVGSYDAYNPSRNDLLSSYNSLRAGDAVVTNGHTFMISRNDSRNKKVYAYEQTPPKAVYTVHSYNQLADNKYMPFTTKYMDIIINRIEDLKELN